MKRLKGDFYKFYTITDLFHPPRLTPSDDKSRFSEIKKFMKLRLRWLFFYVMKKLTTKQLIARKGNLSKLRLAPRKEVYLVLDNIRSAHNVGAIFRTADAARVKKIYLCGITAHPPRADIEKTALQTIEYQPWEYNPSAKLTVKSLKQKGVQIVALEQTDQSINYKEFKYQKPLAIVVGNEVEGIDENVLALCDAAIEIPMHGIANSLNITTATGIVLLYLI